MGEPVYFVNKILNAIVEEYGDERAAEAFEQGAQQQAIQAAINLLKMGVLSLEQIAQAQGLPLEKVLELQQQLSKKE